MSIIYEALSKIGKDSNNKKLSEEQNKKEEKKKLDIFRLSVVLLISLILGTGLYFGLYFYKKLSSNKDFNKRIRRLTHKRITSSLTLSPSEKELGLILHGIFYSEQDSYVIINGQILKVDDEIKGFIVKKITPTKIYLERKENSQVVELSFE